MLHRNVENFIGCDSSYRTASIVLYGAPFDSTTSYRPGARFGPAAMRHESYGLETYSPYQDKDLTDGNVFDSGDLELCFGSSESALVDIESRAAEILRDGKLPLLLGGEHLVTLGAVRAAMRKYPDLHIVHFDAHADLRDDYLGAQLSHACVLRRCHDLVGDGRIHQFCIRSGDREEFQFAARHTDMHKFDFTGLTELTGWLCQTDVPVSSDHFDLDCLDPSAFPGTGHARGGRRQLFAAAWGHPHRDESEHHWRGRERAGTHARPERRFHGHGLQGAAGIAAGTGKVSSHPCRKRRPRRPAEGSRPFPTFSTLSGERM